MRAKRMVLFYIPCINSWQITSLKNRPFVVLHVHPSRTTLHCFLADKVVMGNDFRILVQHHLQSMYHFVCEIMCIFRVLQMTDTIDS